MWKNWIWHFCLHIHLVCPFSSVINSSDIVHDFMVCVCVFSIRILYFCRFWGLVCWFYDSHFSFVIACIHFHLSSFLSFSCCCCCCGWRRKKRQMKNLATVWMVWKLCSFPSNGTKYICVCMFVHCKVVNVLPFCRCCRYCSFDVLILGNCMA